MDSAKQDAASRRFVFGPRRRSFMLGLAAGMGIWMGLMGPPLPLVGSDLSKAIARAEVAPARWLPKIWLAARRLGTDHVPAPTQNAACEAKGAPGCHAD
jgi:hypothetical protein